MTLLDEIHELQRRHPEAVRYERMALDLAASLLELIYEQSEGQPPNIVTRWKGEDYLDLPEKFELIDARLRPKHWQMYADYRLKRQSKALR